jgi:hypothetical protein
MSDTEQHAEPTNEGLGIEPQGCGPVLFACAALWILVFVVLAGCTRPLEHATAELECQVGHVAGKFLTTTDELADGRYGGQVRMWRENEDGSRRLFMYPEDRIVACRELETPR